VTEPPHDSTTSIDTASSASVSIVPAGALALPLASSHLLRQVPAGDFISALPRSGRIMARAWFYLLPSAVVCAIVALSHLPSLVVLPLAFLGLAWRRGSERPAFWLATRRRNRAERRTQVTGTIWAESCFLTTAGERTAVLARYRGSPTGDANLDETRGIDFFLDTDSGQRFLVRVSDQTYLHHWPRRVRWGALAESSIGPGDRVTISGVEVAEVDPMSERGGLRDTPLRSVLVGSPDVPLVIRPLPSPAREVR
jgi:hypothetical protein